MRDGSYIHGANIENSSYGLSICAERNAMFQMVLKGYKKRRCSSNVCYWLYQKAYFTLWSL
ncbi:MAG: hypothetical protein L6U99_12695 [Clostridium sp.]|nr:MAG: hypothetical protein L6U99_12695 [Clostridium sp.]